MGLAQAMLHNPDVLILDEPTDGLDPNQKFQVRSLIKEILQDKAIIISTHILDEVESLCNRTLIIAQGREVVSGTPQQLTQRSKYYNAVTIVLPTAVAQNASAELGKLPHVADIETRHINDNQDELVVLANKGESIGQMVAALAHQQ